MKINTEGGVGCGLLLFALLVYLIMMAPCIIVAVGVYRWMAG